MPDTAKKQRSVLRQQCRSARRALPLSERHLAEARIMRQLCVLPAFWRAQRVGAYFADDGEVNPAALLARLQGQAKSYYFPILDPLRRRRLLFARHQPHRLLVNNSYHIPEPDIRQSTLIPAWTLEVVLVPLVAFDSAGHRLGRGGGFYDGTFTRYRMPRQPILIGLAYECQRVEKIPVCSWDVGLNYVVTEREVIACVTG